MSTRKARWGQFLLLTISLLLLFGGWVTWFNYDPSEFRWYTRVWTTALGFAVVCGGIWAIYNWRLAWQVRWS